MVEEHARLYRTQQVPGAPRAAGAARGLELGRTVSWPFGPPDETDDIGGGQNATARSFSITYAGALRARRRRERS
jgi:hypothetical protein